MNMIKSYICSKAPAQKSINHNTDVQAVIFDIQFLFKFALCLLLPFPYHLLTKEVQLLLEVQWKVRQPVLVVPGKR